MRLPIWGNLSLNGPFMMCKRWASTAKMLRDIQDMPSPVGLPLVGTTFSLLNAASNSSIHKYIDRRHKELGNIFRDTIGPVTGVFTSDPEVMRAVFTKYEGKYPEHLLPDPWVIFNELNRCKRGLFFMNGEEWLETRRVMNKLLLRPRAEEWIDTPISLVADNLVASWINKSASSGFQPDLEKELYRLSLDVILSVMLGSAYKTSSKKFDELLTKFSEVVHGISINTSKMFLLPARFYQKLKLPAWTKFAQSFKQSLIYGAQMVDEIYRLDDLGDGLTSRMIGEGMDKEMITRILIDFIIAAGDTTAFTTQWALYLLSKNPQIIKEFQSTEVSSEEEQVYMRGIIKETMRLYPAASFLTRFLPTVCVIAEHVFPAKTLVVMSLYTAGRDCQYFPHPLKFNPKRWMKQNNDFKGVICPYASIPFAMGARSCIGRKIAMTQMKETLSKILRNFNLQLLNKTHVDDVLQLMLKPKDKIRISVSQK